MAATNGDDKDKDDCDVDRVATIIDQCQPGDTSAMGTMIRAGNAFLDAVADAINEDDSDRTARRCSTSTGQAGIYVFLPCSVRASAELVEAKYQTDEWFIMKTGIVKAGRLHARLHKEEFASLTKVSLAQCVPDQPQPLDDDEYADTLNKHARIAGNKYEMKSDILFAIPLDTSQEEQVREAVGIVIGAAVPVAVMNSWLQYDNTSSLGLGHSEWVLCRQDVFMQLQFGGPLTNGYGGVLKTIMRECEKNLLSGDQVALGIESVALYRTADDANPLQILVDRTTNTAMKFTKTEVAIVVEKVTAVSAAAYTKTAPATAATSIPSAAAATLTITNAAASTVAKRLPITTSKK